MNLRGSCAALATALSAKYATYQEFQGGENLNSYLNDNGLLVSMCINLNIFTSQFSCALTKKDRILSTSWIQKNETGFRVFNSASFLFPNINVGMVIDPTHLEVQCLYPADGMTAGRDDLLVNGRKAKSCGPVSNDVRYGSKGFDSWPKWKRLVVREAWNMYAQINFQNNHNVSCDDFLMQPEDNPVPTNPAVVIREINETKQN